MAADTPPTQPQAPASQTVDGVEYVAVESRACTAEEEYFLKLDEESVRQAIPRLNDALARLLTLATALAGGTLGLLKDDVCSGWGRVGAALCFFLAVLVAAYGVVPFQRTRLSTPEEIADALDAARLHKRRLMLVTLAALMAGLFVALLGTAAKVFA